MVLRCAHALAIMLGFFAAAGCGNDAGAKDLSAPSDATAPRCNAGDMRECACLGEGVGVQTCNAAGGFDPCEGCIAPMPAGGSGGVAASPAPGTGGAAPDANTGGTELSTTDAGVFATDVGTAPGTSCGEALPVLCELGVEKCCVRSLTTDTCIPAAESCACDRPDCTVMEATCDGPEDCTNGEVCCGTLGGGGGTYESFRCAATCEFIQQQREACHEDDPKCPALLVCANSQLLSNVQVCIDPASIRQ